jgi:hypothetical protein
VGDPSAFSTKKKCTSRCPESAEFRIFLANSENAGVGFYKRAPERFIGSLGDVLVIRVRNIADGFGARLFADGVPAHSVGNQKQVAVLAESLTFRSGHVDGERILVMTASQPDVGAAGLLNRIEAGQISRPSLWKVSPCPNYRAGWGFPGERCRAKLPGLSFTFPSEASYCDEPIPVLTEQNGLTITAALT